MEKPQKDINYLKDYGRIDTTYQMVKHCYIYFGCWNHVCAEMNHILSLAVVIPYDMYLEFSDRWLHQKWKFKKPMTFH